MVKKSMPQQSDAKENNETDIMKSFNSPNRRARRPVMGIEIALATPNDVITQVPSLVDEPRNPEIVGIATFDMVESSICINVANDNAIVTKTKFSPLRGEILIV